MNTKYKGSYFERKVKEKLENDGYYVTRNSASKCPDLLAFHPNKNTKLAVECKGHDFPLKASEKAHLKLLEEKYGFFTYVARPKYSVYSYKPDNIILERTEIE